VNNDLHSPTATKPVLVTRAEQLNAQLEALTSRTTRAVAQLRAESRSILRDVDGWTAQLQQFRVDAELARLDARDELEATRRAIHEKEHALGRRLDDARADSAAAWAALRRGLEEAVHDLHRAIEGNAQGGEGRG
jgi:F0F1-type ATP synthase membrane subunit b/b'